MPTTQKVLMVVIVIVIIAIGGYYWYMSSPDHAGTQSDAQSALGSASEDTALPSGSDDSDAAMQADLKSIDTQMGGFDSDSSSVNQGISGQASGDTQ